LTFDGALAGTIVVELGAREAVGICGSLLAQLGATVIIVEPSERAAPRDACRGQSAAGKLSVSYNGKSDQDRKLLGALMARADVVLTSSDVDPADLRISSMEPENIVCDITAFGGTGPLAGRAFSEMQLQALSGIVHTTGNRDGPPLPICVPVIGYMTGAYGAAAVLAALRVRRRQGFSQRVEVAMFDAAIVSLNVFLAGVLTGQVADRSRMGNRHPAISPWNLYPTGDGWALICAGSQIQWERLCDQMGQPEISGMFKTQSERVLRADEVDLALGAWTRTMTTSDCVAKLSAAGVASGPIAPLDQYPREDNLEFRGMIRKLHDAVAGRDVYVPASPLTLRGSPPVQAETISVPDAGRAEVERIARTDPPKRASMGFEKRDRPLAGIRVIEVGQYTTAPTCARHLAHLGADVIKIEKPGGDESRTYGPFVDGRSEVNWLNNADKRDIMLDILSPEGAGVLTALLRTADVFIENSKPGTLARFGFSYDALMKINPRLVYCAISGFGATSLYADRPGFDTVIQAMSGFMSAANRGGEPLKSGISTSDLMGAEIGIVAILAALEHRDRTGRGQFIDLSMQDISCWITGPCWNLEPNEVVRPVIVHCSDGFVLAETSEAALSTILSDARLTLETVAGQSRAEVVALLEAAGISAAPVNSVREAVEMPHTLQRKIWFMMQVGKHQWPTLSCPMRLHLTPPEIRRGAPDLNQDGEAILRELGNPLANGTIRVEASV
jgi:crotonobetainyl-CoA:carnitine CoA-transferase CaiB-like acyl-CoA transferase